MIITKLALDRRTFLRGAGVALALPFLDAMVPALSPPQPRPARSVWGSCTCPTGCSCRISHPKGTSGAAYTMTPVLKPLEALREHVVVVSGLSNMPVLANDQGGGVHTRNHAGWLSGVLPSAPKAPTSRARRPSTSTRPTRSAPRRRIRSLELTSNRISRSANCEPATAVRISTRRHGGRRIRPFRMKPIRAWCFSGCSADGGSISARLEQMRKDRSLLDSVMESVIRLERRLGATDRHVLGDYLDSVRDVEMRIHRAEQANETTPLPPWSSPPGIPEEYGRACQVADGSPPPGVSRRCHPCQLPADRTRVERQKPIRGFGVAGGASRCLAPPARPPQHRAEDQDRRLQHVALRVPAREDEGDPRRRRFAARTHAVSLRSWHG